MRFFNWLKRLPPLCFLALAWLAHDTFLRSPPFIRRRACFTLQGSGLIRVDVEGNPKGLFRLRSLKIVPPFILLRCFKCFRTMGSNKRDDVCISG